MHLMALNAEELFELIIFKVSQHADQYKWLQYIIPHTPDPRLSNKLNLNKHKLPTVHKVHL